MLQPRLADQVPLVSAGTAQDHGHGAGSCLRSARNSIPASLNRTKSRSKSSVFSMRKTGRPSGCRWPPAAPADQPGEEKAGFSVSGRGNDDPALGGGKGRILDQLEAQTVTSKQWLRHNQIPTGSLRRMLLHALRISLFAWLGRAKSGSFFIGCRNVASRSLGKPA